MRQKYVVTFEVESNGDNKGIETAAREVQDVFNQLDTKYGETNQVKSTLVKITNTLSGDSYIAPKSGEVAS